MFKLSISLFFGALIGQSEAILPTGGIEVQCADGTCSETLLASQASFDTWPEMNPENNAAMLTVFPPDSDPLLCLGTEQTASYPKSPFVIVAPRGLCTFEQKAVTAQNLGASGIIIYGTLASRYSLNTTQIAANDNKVTSDDVIYPAEFHDYDCDKASADIPTSRLSFDKKKLPYDSSRNDPLLTGTLAQGNLCAVGSTNFTESCPSERCLLTGKLENNGQSMKACCAWDFHVWLYKDGNITADIKIPAFYITMEESDSLLQYMNSKQVRVTMYRRYYPKYNLSSVVIWGLGVFVAGLAAWLSASDYRHAKKINQNATEEMQPMDRSESNNVNGYAQIQGGIMMQEESLELSASHACGFIVFSTAGLLTLFIFKIYNVVKVFYAFGCCGAISQVVFYPLFCRLAAKIGFRDRTAFVTDTMEIGAVSYVGLFATVVSYGLGTVWTIIAFTQPHPDNILFFWVMQDLMGACMCILFLSTIKVNSIKVATVLLTAAFFYDIFFVFLTPLLTKGGKSIMVDVATSGGPPTANPEWCEKYPDDKNCQGGDPLPMLLTIPRMFDYSGGSSLLGLGDIVLPGLLLSFAARYDEAKRFIGSSSSDGREVSQNCTRKSKGYLAPLVVAYGVGLAMANIAVYAMQMGQPALLYLVPCCLGTMVYLGWKRQELNELWETPKVLASCDKMIYGEYSGDDEVERSAVE